MTKTRNLIAAYIGDGYLYGASGNPMAELPLYWAEVACEEGFTLIELRGVPELVADALEKQGTSEQYYADGYEAARAAEPYVGETIY